MTFKVLIGRKLQINKQTFIITRYARNPRSTCLDHLAWENDPLPRRRDPLLGPLPWRSDRAAMNWWLPAYNVVMETCAIKPCVEQVTSCFLFLCVIRLGVFFLRGHLVNIIWIKGRVTSVIDWHKILPIAWRTETDETFAGHAIFGKENLVV